MGKGFLRASYKEKERKGVGQLDNTALIRNICRFHGRGEKNSEWWERNDCILLHLFVWKGFSLTFYLRGAIKNVRELILLHGNRELCSEVHVAGASDNFRE